MRVHADWSPGVDHRRYNSMAPPSPVDEGGPGGMQPPADPATPGVYCDTQGKHEFTKWSKRKDVVGRGSDGVLRHFPLSPMAKKGDSGSRVKHDRRARKRPASIACSDPEQIGDESPARDVRRAMPSLERSASPELREATRGVSYFAREVD